MGANNPLGVANLDPRGMAVTYGLCTTQGLDWQDLCRGPLDTATY